MFPSNAIDMEFVFDYAFIHSHLPPKTPKLFRQKHTFQFLHLFHPEVTITDTILQKVQRLVTRKNFIGETWTTELDLYFKKYGVGLRFVLVAEQDICCQCSYHTIPIANEATNFLIYTSLYEEPV